MEQIAPAALGIGRLFSTIRDAVIIGDPRTGLIVLWNDAAKRIFGYSASEAIGSPMEMLVQSGSSMMSKRIDRRSSLIEAPPMLLLPTHRPRRFTFRLPYLDYLSETEM